MEEKKLSEELRHCLEGNGCADCICYEQKSVLTCPGLLQKAYEAVKRHEEMFPCWIGDTVYADSGVFGILEYEVDNIVIGKTITYQCLAYSKAVGDCPSECLDEVEPDISDFDKTVFLEKEAAEKALKEMGDRKNG